MIPLFRPFVAPEAAQAVANVLASGYIGQGKVVDQFEAALGPWIGRAVTVNSGTSALWLAYDLAGISRGSRVICTPMTCLATCMPLEHLGAEIIWADVNPKTGLIDVEDVRRLFLSNDPGSITAVIAVDYGGRLVDHNSLLTLCHNNQAALIIDCAHSFGHEGDAIRADFCCYSFQAIKHLTTGDGGALVCRRQEDEKLARLKRWFSLDRSTGGFRCEQKVASAGYKFHMNDIAASIGLANLFYVNANVTLHRHHAAAYDQAGFGHQSQRGSNWLFTIHVNDRDQFVKRMAERGVQCARVHTRCDTQNIFNADQRSLPGVTKFDLSQVSIPVGWYLSKEDVQYIIQSVQESM